MRSSRVLELLAELPRLAVARTLRAHPAWSLENLFGVIEGGGPRAATLGQLTIAELLEVGATEDAPRMDHVHRWAEFDRLVFEVLCEAQGDVASGYLRARLGGRRWQMQDSLKRLVATGKVSSTGNTSATRYRVVRT